MAAMVAAVPMAAVLAAPLARAERDDEWTGGGAAVGTDAQVPAVTNEARNRGEPGRSQTGAGRRRQGEEGLHRRGGQALHAESVGTFTIARRVMNPTYSHEGRVFRRDQTIRWGRGGWA